MIINLLNRKYLVTFECSAFTDTLEWIYNLHVLKFYKIFCAGCILAKNKSERNRVIYPICRYAYFYDAIRERQLRDFSAKSRTKRSKSI